MKPSFKITIRQLVLLLNTAVFIVFFICISILFFQMYGKLVVDRFEDEQRQTLLYLKNTFEETLNGINQISLASMQNSYLITLVQSYDNVMTPSERQVFFNNMSENLQEIAYSRSDIVSVNILTDTIEGNNSRVNGLYHYDDYFLSNDIKMKVMDSVECWLPTRSNDTALRIYEDKIITHSRKIYTNLYNGQVIGHVVFNFKEDIFAKVIKDFKIDTRAMTVIVVNEQGIILTGNDRKISAASLEETEHAYLADVITEKNFEGINQKNVAGDKLVSYGTINGTGWTLVAIADHKSIIAPVTELNSKVIWISLVVIAIFILLSSLVSMFISKPVRRFASYVKRYDYSKENLSSFEQDYIAGKHKIKEIDLLYKRFHDMTVRMQGLIEQLYQEENRKKKAELEILHAQINPHFLYNTLESINWFALLADQKEVSTMVTLLGDFLRLSLNKGKNTYTIEKEIDHLKSYMEIQAIRYSGKIEYSINVEDEWILDCYTVKLLLQPIVENCILHAFELTGSMGTIELTVKYSDEKIMFIINDNGKGIGKEQLEYLNNPESKAGYGLRNVRERINLYYGEDYGVYIQSQINVGTQVLLTIPVKKTDF